MSDCWECYVLAGRGLCYVLIMRPEESYRLWCVAVCDLETSRMRRPWPALGRSATRGGGNWILHLTQNNIRSCHTNCPHQEHQFLFIRQFTLYAMHANYLQVSLNYGPRSENRLPQNTHQKTNSYN